MRLNFFCTKDRDSWNRDGPILKVKNTCETSKWETDETLPDIRQSKNLAVLYRLSLDELIEFDPNIQEIEQVIENTSEEMQEKIDWTKVWGKKYPILSTYQKKVQIRGYAEQLKAMLDRLKRDYGYNDTDAFLVLKDIMSSVWKQNK